MEPEAFGPYLLARKIATGGTAEIFLARRDGADGFARHIAIKRILPQLAEEKGFVQLLLDEARLAAHLHHGHIVQIHDVGEIDGRAYIAMEYLPGTDVGRLMKKAARRTRRVLVAHTDLEYRKQLIRQLKTLDRRIELIPAHDADEVARRSADGPVDLALVDAKLATLVVDRLASNHPELLRTIVLGNAPALRPASTTLVTTDDDPRIITELADCCLRAPMPLDIAMQIIRAIADGLDHAHTAVDYADQPLHIVHRDINPSNVLVSKSGTVKLVDFGIARAATTAEGRRKGFVGTYDYMSPEQTEGDPVDARSDLFSLGTLIQVLITGEHPYKGDDMFATMRAVREDRPPPLDARVPGTPPLLVDIAVRAAEKDPADRHASAEAMLADIEEVVRRSGINLSPKRLASYVRVIFGEEVKRFGVTTMSMPAIKLDDAGGAAPVRPRASVDGVGRPISDRGSIQEVAPLRKLPTNPPPTMDEIQALGADGQPVATDPDPLAAPLEDDGLATIAARPAARASLPGEAPDDDGLATIAARPSARGSLSGEEAAPPAARPSQPGEVRGLRLTPANGLMTVPGRRLLDAEAADDPFAPSAEPAPAIDSPPPLDAAPSDEEDEDGPTQVAPPSPEVLAALAAAGRPRSEAPPPRTPDPIEVEAPADHIARRLGAARARPRPDPVAVHRPAAISARQSAVRTPIGDRDSLHAWHSVDQPGPPPSRRAAAGESAMRIVLGIVIGALVGLAGLYVWWRTGAGG